MNATPLQVKIAGLGRAVPKRVVTGQDIEQLCDLPGGWVAQHTGITQRHWVTDETDLSLGILAAREALANARLLPWDLDLIINASNSPHTHSEDLSILIHRELDLEATGIPCVSISTGSLGFITALDYAAVQIGLGRHERILIINSETPSTGIDRSDPHSAALHGDMATAAVLTPTPNGEGSEFRESRFETFTSPALSSAGKPTRVDGKELLRQAHRHLPKFIKELRAGLEYELGRVSFVVPHQSTIFAMRSLQQYFGYPDDATIVTADKFGCSASASLPGALYEATTDGRIDRGDEILLLGATKGFSLGGAILVF